MINHVTPYLNLYGHAEAAIALYTRALGAETDCVMRFGDVPAEAMEGGCAAIAPDRVMHAQLRIGAQRLMLSDGPPGEPVATTNVSVNLEFDDPAELERRFEALAAEGTVTMPVDDVFWGARFGMLTDQFGIRWMFVCPLATGAKPSCDGAAAAR